jgi:hypothetical protein
MPLVLATGAATESGHAYADVMGTSYQYPPRYRNLIQSGKLFVYYRGRRLQGGGTQPQVYLGTGTIGKVLTDADQGLLTCSVEDYCEFDVPVPFKASDGRYLEPGGIRRGYFQPGVRLIAMDVYADIVARANLIPRDAGPLTDLTYAGTTDARTIEEVSRRAVAEMLEARSDIKSVLHMPLNNPGYDIRAETQQGPLYVEVKGTRSSRAQFFLSEGERRFAERNDDRYIIAVVTEIDIDRRTCGPIRMLSAAPTRATAQLHEHQWRGELA